MEMADTELKNKIEALLFSSGRKLDQTFMSQITGAGDADVKKALNELAYEFEKRNSALMVFQEGSEWKISVKERYIPLVRNIVSDTELSKSVLETLAIIAWKSPLLQSDVIKTRSNKGYDHISELERLGFIIKEKHGRSFMIKTTEKFYDYFDIGDKKTFKQMLRKKPAEGQQKLGDLEVIDEKPAPGTEGVEVVDLPKSESEESEQGIEPSAKIDWGDSEAEDKKEEQESPDDGSSAKDAVSEIEKMVGEIEKSAKKPMPKRKEDSEDAEEQETPDDVSDEESDSSDATTDEGSDTEKDR